DKVFVMVITLGLTVFVDLITAVAVGLILAGFATARWMEREELAGVTSLALSGKDNDLTDEERALLALHNGDIGIVVLRGRFSYASARELTQRLGIALTGHKVVIYDFTGAAHVDTSAALAIEEMVIEANSETAGCFLAGLSGQAEATLESLGILDDVPADRVVATRLEAIKRAGALLDALR
ncbi:MAG: STAS domain-containing protein, partial [Proteobacteria bacterium]|nr:STAS domain-containing protein [Pseudomonadota bacterium]